MAEASTSILPAVIGLAGVLIGGIITAGANYLLAVRKERADEAEALRLQAREVKKAARLVADELETNRNIIQVSLESNRSLAEQAPLSKDTWRDCRIILSGALRDGEWFDTTAAYYHLEMLMAMVDPKISNHPLLGDFLKTVIDKANKALSALKSYAMSDTS